MPLNAGLVSAMYLASPSQNAVHSTPGQMAFTVTPYGASSLAMTRVNVMTPPLATEYGGIVSAASGPAIEAMLMIRPARRSMKCGAMALQHRKTDFRFTAYVRSQSSSLLFVNGMPGEEAMPALLTRMSMGPSSARTRSSAAWTSVALVTSQRMASALRPSLPTSRATCCALPSWMSGIATFAPSRAMHITIPSPMPDPPPVTTASLFSSLMAGLQSPAVRFESDAGPRYGS